MSYLYPLLHSDHFVVLLKLVKVVNYLKNFLKQIPQYRRYVNNNITN
jgi:hypothetical protein